MSLVRAEYQTVKSHVIGHMVRGSSTAVAPGRVPDEAPWLTTVPWLSGSMPVWNNLHGWSRFQMKGFRTQNWGSHSLISVYGGMIGVYLNEVEVRGEQSLFPCLPCSAESWFWCFRLNITYIVLRPWLFFCDKILHIPDCLYLLKKASPLLCNGFSLKVLKVTTKTHLERD